MPTTSPAVLPLDELELLLDELLDDVLLDELEELAEDELLLELDDVELLEELDDDELLDELVPTEPEQSPAALLPCTERLSILGKPALLVASKRSRLLPASRLTLTVCELP